MTMWYGLAVLGFLIVGLLSGWLLASIRTKRFHIEASLLSVRIAERESQIMKLDGELVAERQKNIDLASLLAGARSDHLHLEERLTIDARRIAEIQDRMKLEFENLAGRLLEEKSAKFLDQNQQHLSTLLTPLRDRLGEFRERMEKIHNEEEKSAAALGAQLKNLSDLNRQMTEEASNLTNALKGQSKIQGVWGELILERILEKSGLTKGIEYETQVSFSDENGSRKIPDVVIHLPEGKNLIIDAKVSLAAYEKAVNAADAGMKDGALREHVASLRRHIEDLSRKDYPSLPDLRSPDFVLMFVPIEPALHLALQADPALYSDAFEKNIILVSSSTLLVSLRAVESVWRHQKQTENAQEIARQAGNLHDAFILFTQSLEEIGSRLDQAKAAYDLSLSRLATGRGNLVKRTLELQKLGTRGDKTLPPTIARLAEE